jgi:penicillin-binding protein 1A
MGMDDNRPLGRGEWGGTAALGMWVDFMADALDGVPIAKIKRPEGMVAVRVSESTGSRSRTKKRSAPAGFAVLTAVGEYIREPSIS